VKDFCRVFGSGEHQILLMTGADEIEGFPVIRGYFRSTVEGVGISWFTWKFAEDQDPADYLGEVTEDQVRRQASEADQAIHQTMGVM